MRNETIEPWISLGELCSGGHLEGGSREDLLINAKEILYNHIWDEMRRYGEICPPFIKNPESSDFVKSLGVQEIITLDVKGYGRLLRQNDHFVIIVKKDLLETQKRTVIAHELGHIFLESVNRSIRKDISPNWSSVEGPAFEIGRQVLVPKQYLLRSVNLDVSIKSFNELKEKYRVSKNVMAFRLVHDLKLWDAYMFFTMYDSVEGKIILPKINERFKGASFKNFNLNKNWDSVAEVLRKSSIALQKYITEKRKINGHYYHIQGYSKVGKVGRNMSCLIKRA